MKYKFRILIFLGKGRERKVMVLFLGKCEFYVYFKFAGKVRVYIFELGVVLRFFQLCCFFDLLYCSQVLNCDYFLVFSGFFRLVYFFWLFRCFKSVILKVLVRYFFIYLVVGKILVFLFVKQRGEYGLVFRERIVRLFVFFLFCVVRRVIGF